MDENLNGQVNPETGNAGSTPEDPKDAWRRGRAAVKGVLFDKTPPETPANGEAAAGANGGGGWSATRNSNSGASSGRGRGNGGAVPPQLPHPGAWGAPLELQPGVHYKALTLPPGYVPGYPVPPGTADEDEGIGPGLIEYWRLVRQRKGTILLAGAVGCILAIMYTLPMTPIYSASTTLEVQEMNRNFMNMSNVNPVATDSEGFGMQVDIQTQLRIIQSDMLLSRVTKKFENAAPTVDYAHNDYLQYLAELGLIGFALALGVMGRCLYWMGRGLDRSRLVAGACGAVAAMGMHSMVDFNLYIPANALVLAWILGMATAPALTEGQRATSE